MCSHSPPLTIHLSNWLSCSPHSTKKHVSSFFRSERPLLFHSERHFVPKVERIGWGWSCRLSVILRLFSWPLYEIAVVLLADRCRWTRGVFVYTKPWNLNRLFCYPSSRWSIFVCLGLQSSSIDGIVGQRSALNCRVRKCTLIFSTSEDYVQAVRDALLRTCPELAFTFELPEQNVLQFTCASQRKMASVGTTGKPYLSLFFLLLVATLRQYMEVWSFL